MGRLSAVKVQLELEFIAWDVFVLLDWLQSPVVQVDICYKYKYATEKKKVLVHHFLVETL